VSCNWAERYTNSETPPNVAGTSVVEEMIRSDVAESELDRPAAGHEPAHRTAAVLVSGA
jgi:hypothetical protein